MNRTQILPSARPGADLRRLLGELGREAGAHAFDVAPNPCVGASVLAGEREVARGFHRVWGGAHAEVDALERARASAIPPEEWDVLAITLEPCSSAGKTGPCTDAIVASGIRHVVVGALDPDPRHRGRGIELLREAGLRVDVLEGASPIDSVSPHFVSWTARERLRRPRPWVIAKWAQTRSGHLSPPEDFADGRTISSPESLAEVHELRARVDAIVTGIGTVLADDPRLTARGRRAPARPPLRVVLDGELTTPPEAALLRPAAAGEAAGPVVLVCKAGASGVRHRALEERGARVVHVRPDRSGRVDLRNALAWLWDEGVQRVLLEAGPTLVGAMLEAGFVDQIRVYTGAVAGGLGQGLAHELSRASLLARAHRECGPDSVLEAFVRPSG